VQNSCSICHAVREKLYIRYDGCVFGCEAFKYIPFFDGDGNPILPNSIYVRSIEEIVDNSPYLSKSKEFVERYSNIKPTTDACPVQKYLKETRKKNELSN
jgi:MoaA/NifB/PqqE/SkfB family radical SAM enzyme